MKKPKYIIGIDEAGETVWETVARPCLLLVEDLKTSSDKVYSSCKEGAENICHNR